MPKRKKIPLAFKAKSYFIKSKTVLLETNVVPNGSKEFQKRAGVLRFRATNALYHTKV